MSLRASTDPDSIVGDGQTALAEQSKRLRWSLSEAEMRDQPKLLVARIKKAF